MKEFKGSGTLWQMPRALALLLPLLAGGAAEAAPSCQPAARVEGDEPAAREVRDLLAARGVGAEAALPCPAVHAVIRQTNAGGLVAVLRDDSGHERSYEVRDRATAATIVESWARHDLEDPLLVRARPVPPLAEPAPRRLPVSAALLAGTAHGTDGSIWSDGTVTGCVKIGSVCAGLLARTAQDSGEYGDADRYDTYRTAIDALATVDGWRRRGRWSLGLGLGFGVGWERSVPEKRVAGAHEESAGLRLESRLTGGWELARGLDLTLSVTAGASPLAREGKIHENGAVFAGEPRGWLRPAIGLRYGAP